MQMFACSILWHQGFPTHVIFGRVSISISHFCWRLNCCSSLTFVTRIDFYVFILPCACLHATFGQIPSSQVQTWIMSADRKRRSKSYAHPRMCFSNRFSFVLHFVAIIWHTCGTDQQEITVWMQYPMVCINCLFSLECLLYLILL